MAQEEDKKRRQAMDWLQSHAKLSSELWLPAKQRLLVVAGSGVLIEKASWPAAAAAAITLLLLTASAEAAGVQTDQAHAFFSTRTNR